MAINKKLIHFKNKENFNIEVANNNILDTSIVFIQDTLEIYTHGTFYDGSKVDLSNIEESILNILDTKADKTEIPTKVSELEDDISIVTLNDSTPIVESLVGNELIPIKQDGENKAVSVEQIKNNILALPSKYEFVDLGLPSGTKWATTNIGAVNPEDAGLYFAWGETEGYTAEDVTAGKKAFNWNDYKFTTDEGSTFTKYNETDGKISLDLEDDAAYQSDNTCRIPTKDECQELIDNTISTWETLNGVNGRRFTSNINGNSIFIPAAGYCGLGSVYSVSSVGYLLSSFLYEINSRYGWDLGFGSAGAGVGDFSSRFNGLTIRPVQAPNTPPTTINLKELQDKVEEAKEVFIITSDMIEETGVSTLVVTPSSSYKFTDDGYNQLCKAVQNNKIIVIDEGIINLIIPNAVPYGLDPIIHKEKIIITDVLYSQQQDDIINRISLMFRAYDKDYNYITEYELHIYEDFIRFSYRSLPTLETAGEGNKFLTDDGTYKEVSKEVFIVTSDMFEQTAATDLIPTLTFTDEGWADFIGAVEANKIIALDYTVSGTLIFQATPMAIIRPSAGYFILTGFTYDPDNVYANGFLSWLSQTEDSPAVYAITFSDKNVTSQVLNTPSEVYQFNPIKFSTVEDFNNLKEALDNGKIIVSSAFKTPYFIDYYNDNEIVIQDQTNYELSGDREVKVGSTTYILKSDGTRTLTATNINLKANADGTKFLADDGEYKEIVVPTKVSELENDANYFSNSKSIEDGVYIYTTDNEFIKPDDWDTTNNSKAVAIAIIDHRCSFGIPLSSSIFTANSFRHHVYGGKGIDIAEIPNCTTTEEALNDFNGYSHTQAIIQQSFSSAAKIAYNHTFPNGEHGYLPSYGELYVFSLYKDAIANAANKVGKDYNYDDFEMYGHIISSTEYGANSYYGIIYGGYTNEYNDAVVDKDYDHYTDFSTASDYYNQVIPFLHIERPKDIIQTDGDGTKFLSDDGSYKEISASSNSGTVTLITAGPGLSGGTITDLGEIKASLKSETSSTLDSANMYSVTDRQYAVGLDSSGYLSVNIPWEDTKNTSGSINDNTNKLFVIGSVSLSESSQTYSNSSVYIQSGNLYATNFYTASDKQYKTNIESILDYDNCPKVKQFDWKKDGSHSYGFIAQELEELGYKELVDTDEEGFKTVNYPATLSLVMGKMQNKIELLELKILELENKLANKF